MPMYNLLEYSDNFSMTSGSLWNYYRDEVNYSTNEIDDNDYKINNNKTRTSKSLKYKTKIIGSTLNNNGRLNAKVVAPLKYLSNFWRSLDFPLINCEIELNLTWSNYCVISEISRTPELGGANPADATLSGATFQISNTKLYISVVTLSIKFLKNIKHGFKRTICGNKYRSEKIKQSKNNNLDYLIDPTFGNINILFVISFKNGDDDPTRKFFDEYYMSLVEFKDFNALIDNKPFFDQPVKTYRNFKK